MDTGGGVHDGSPLYGVGIDNFSVAEGRHPDAQAMLARGKGVKFSTAHSIWVQTGAELGIPGVLILLGVFAMSGKALATIGAASRPAGGRVSLRARTAGGARATAHRCPGRSLRRRDVLVPSLLASVAAVRADPRGGEAGPHQGKRATPRRGAQKAADSGEVAPFGGLSGAPRAGPGSLDACSPLARQDGLFRPGPDGLLASGHVTPRTAVERHDGE